MSETSISHQIKGGLRCLNYLTLLNSSKNVLLASSCSLMNAFGASACNSSASINAVVVILNANLLNTSRPFWLVLFYAASSVAGASTTHQLNNHTAKVLPRSISELTWQVAASLRQEDKISSCEEDLWTLWYFRKMEFRHPEESRSERVKVIFSLREISLVSIMGFTASTTSWTSEGTL